MRRLMVMMFVFAGLLFTLAENPDVIAQNTRTDFVQTQMDAIFLIHDNSVTALYSVSYIQPADMEEVRWVFPIPSDATLVELAPSLIAPLVQLRTEPIIEPPDEPCQLTPTISYGHGYLPTVEYYPPQDAELTEFEDAQSAIGWMQERVESVGYIDRSDDNPRFVGMSITPNNEVSVGEYSSGGKYNVNLSATLLVEYPGNVPFFPLNIRASAYETHLDNYDQTGFMPATAYVFADVPYQVSNMSTLTVDLSTVTSGSNIIQNIMRDFDGTPIFFDTLDGEYYSRLNQAVHQALGYGFITEFIGQFNDFLSVDFREAFPETGALFREITTNYPVMTRFRTFLHDEYDIPNPIFTPAPDLEEFQINLAHEVDPAQFYGCTTRSLYDAELEARLPEGRSYLADLQIQVAHPAGWTLNQPRNNLYVLSPEVIDNATLIAVESGEDGPPMFAFKPFEEEFASDRYHTFLPDHTWEPFSNVGNTMPRSIGARNAFTIYYPSHSTASPYTNDDLGSAEGVRMAIITTHADYAENHQRYEDMLTYVATRQFWLSPRLRHTIFIGGPDDLIQIGYPENWIERLDAGRNRIILPETVDVTDSDTPMIRVLRVPPDWTGDIIGWMILQYGFLDRDLFTAENPTPIPFEHNGRRGYLLRAEGSPARVVEISAPTDVYQSYRGTLQLIAETAIITEPEAD